MKTFKDYEQVIKNAVAEIDAADPDWNYRVKHIGADKVRIYWSYLNKEKNDCFTLNLLSHEAVINGTFIVSRTPDGKMIDGYAVSENPPTRIESYEAAIRRSVSDIASYANRMY